MACCQPWAMESCCGQTAKPGGTCWGYVAAGSCSDLVVGNGDDQFLIRLADIVQGLSVRASSACSSHPASLAQLCFTSPYFPVPGDTASKQNALLKHGAKLHRQFAQYTPIRVLGVWENIHVVRVLWMALLANLAIWALANPAQTAIAQ